MSNKAFLSRKSCSSCSIRLDKIKKRDIRTISSEELLNKLNAYKLSVQTQKDIPDDSIIKAGDLVCMKCITNANRSTPNEEHSRKRKRSLSVHRFFRDTQEIVGTTSNNIEEIEPEEMQIETIRVEIPRTKSSHITCVVCSSKKKLMTVPAEAYTDAYIRNNILIPKGKYKINFY